MTAAGLAGRLVALRATLRRMQREPVRTTQLLAAVVALVALAGCAAPTPTPSPAPERCIDLATRQAVALSWSQSGTFLGIGMVGPDGSPSAGVIDAHGRPVGEPIDDQDVEPSSVVVTPDGRLAWLASSGGETLLVEDRPQGFFVTSVPEGVDGLGWTAIGFALLQHAPDGGSRILNLDVDRPDSPTVSYATDLHVERLWISADPEHMVLTLAHPDHHDVPATFQVVGSGTEHHLAPAGADASGASMPSLRRWVVYRSAATSRMEAMSVLDGAATVTLADRPAERGMISDRGILAYVPAEPYGQVCLVDVSAKLP